jgi:hypothetical protein
MALFKVFLWFGAGRSAGGACFIYVHSCSFAAKSAFFRGDAARCKSTAGSTDVSKTTGNHWLPVAVMQVFLSYLARRNGTHSVASGSVSIDSNQLADPPGIGTGIAPKYAYGNQESSRNYGRPSQHFPPSNITTPIPPLILISPPDPGSLRLPGVPVFES